MRTGPRSNFSLLPFPLRCKMIFLLDDGATFDGLQNDPEVREEYAKRGLKLTASAVTRIKKSREYQEITAKRRKKQLADQSEQITSALLRDAGELDTVSDQVKVSLLRLVQECVSANPDDTKEVERLVRSAVTLTNQSKDQQIADWKRKYQDERELRLAAEKEWQAREAELLVKIEQLEKDRAESGLGGLSEEVIRSAEEKIKLL